MWPHRELERHRPVWFGPICHQNPRSERYSNPFSDSFMAKFAFWGFCELPRTPERRSSQNPRPKAYGCLWLRSVACGYYPYFLIIPIGRGYRMGAPGNRTVAHSGLERLLVGVRWGR